MDHDPDVIIDTDRDALSNSPDADDPGFRVGDQVKVNDGMLTRD